MHKHAVPYLAVLAGVSAALLAPAGANAASTPPVTNTKAPTVTGTAARGDTLSGTAGTWTGQVGALGYQWEHCNASGAACAPIQGASTHSYTLAKSDEGHRIVLKVSGTNPSGTVSEQSAPTATVVASSPLAAAKPTVAGSYQVGQTLSAANSSWIGIGNTYAYRWEDCGPGGVTCTPITGATRLSYTLTAADYQQGTVAFEVIATNPDGSADSATAPKTVTETPATSVTFSPYVEIRHQDTTPSLFDVTAENPAKSVILTAMMSSGVSGQAACTPEWDNGETLAQGAADPDLGGLIAKMQPAGETVSVSFMGFADQTGINPELAVNCTSASSLQAAYQSVVTAYKLSAIDLDVEDASGIQTPSVNARRAVAIAAVQAAQAKASKPLTVSVTLPLSTTGLQVDAQTAISQLLSAGVKLHAINLMAFSMTATLKGTQSAVAEQALTDAAGQIAKLYAQAGVSLGVYDAWPLMGATIKEGLNEDPGVVGQTWTLADARSLRTFALQNHMGLLSMYDLQRDQQCSQANGNSPSFCSGVTQTPLEFSDTLLGTL